MEIGKQVENITILMVINNNNNNLANNKLINTSIIYIFILSYYPTHIQRSNSLKLKLEVAWKFGIGSWKLEVD